MNAATRREILALLAEASVLEPELRWGQLVATICLVASEREEGSIWEIEDEAFLAALRAHMAMRQDPTAPRATSVELPLPLAQSESLEK
jgi:hypothetical protein